MTREEILSSLTRLLAPLSMQAQEPGSNFEKFRDTLKFSLSQVAWESRRTGAAFPDSRSYMLPDEVRKKLNQDTDDVVAAMPTRTAADAVYWVRERNLPIIAGVEERIENYLEPEHSFGPFADVHAKQSWYDFYRVPKKLRFQVLFGGIPDFIIITLQQDALLPATGMYTSLDLEDCSIWTSVKTITPGGDKKYAGVRAKRCRIEFATNAFINSSGFVNVFSLSFQIGFEPYDAFTNGVEDEPVEPKMNYPAQITYSFTGTKWTLESIDDCSLPVFGDTIPFDAAQNIQPVYLESEQLVYFSVPAQKDTLTISQNTNDRLSLLGNTNITDTGWYLPVVSIDNVLGIDLFGKMTFAGFIGFRFGQGLQASWPGLQNGRIVIEKSLLLCRPGRLSLKYTFTSPPRLRQQLSCFKALTGGDTRSQVTLVPSVNGEGIFINDNQQVEAHLQPVNISGRVDQPLNASQQRFKLANFFGVVFFVKIKQDTTVFLIGSRTSPVAGDEQPARVPQSICLRNALLTTDNPVSILVEGKLNGPELISSGEFNLVFKVYRVVNMLPDPYISNQADIFDLQEVLRFNDLVRNGKDALPAQQLFTIDSVVQFNEEEANLSFRMNQAPFDNHVPDELLFHRGFPIVNVCGSAEQNSEFSKNDIQAIRNADLANLVGSYAFLHWLPGNRSLVDVSGRANQWGVAFSTIIPNDDTLLPESLGYPHNFPYRLNNMDLVSSGRLSRLFTLPHIQWEPVMNIKNPLVPEPGVPEPGVPAIFNFIDNGAPTRLASAQKSDVELTPVQLYQYILNGFNGDENKKAVAAHFNLPFGICAFAYFSPVNLPGLPQATMAAKQPSFSGKKTGDLTGGMQLRLQAVPPEGTVITDSDNRRSYFPGRALQTLSNHGSTSILGNIINGQFNKKFSFGPDAKVPLQKIDFAGYGASVFSNWLNSSANFGAVSQVRFDVMIGRTAHEVVQIKSILFPWGVPVVRSIVIERKNVGIVTRYDSGWVARGAGEFNFLSYIEGVFREFNPYRFHPGTVKGIYNVTHIRDIPEAMDIFLTVASPIPVRFSGVYFNGDVEIENLETGALPKAAGVKGKRVHAVDQFGYVMLADTSMLNSTTTLQSICPPQMFKDLLNHPKVGGSLGGPINAVMNIAGCGQRMQLTRVDVTASNEANVSFVVAVRGSSVLPKEGSWTMVKCLASKDVVPVGATEAVPLIRHGALSVNRVRGQVTSTPIFNRSHHAFGDPKEIDKYANGAPPPNLQYSFLQTTDTQKILFRRPTFFEGTAGKVFTQVPELADAFRLLKTSSIFPNLANVLSLPPSVNELLLTGINGGLKLPDTFFGDPFGGLKNFVPKELLVPAQQVFKLIDEEAFKVFIQYGPPNEPSGFKLDLNSDATEEPATEDRKKWEMVNKDVSIVVELGPLKPLLTFRGSFKAEAGKKPTFEKPVMELGPDLKAIKDILTVLSVVSGQGDIFDDTLQVAMSNSPDSWNYKMSIDQRIPVMQFPDTQMINMSAPPPLIIEASLVLGVFFNISLSADPKSLLKPSAGAVLGFEGMIQIQLISLGAIAAYGVGITRVKAFISLSDPVPQFEFMLGFGATVIVVLPVVGMASVTRSVDLTGSVGNQLEVLAGQMMRGVLSLAGGLLMVAVQIEGRGGVREADDGGAEALFQVIFSLDVGLAFVIKYNFTKKWEEHVKLSDNPKKDIP